VPTGIDCVEALADVELSPAGGITPIADEEEATSESLVSVSFPFVFMFLSLSLAPSLIQQQYE
jgi:hypothetical protein